jgi:hypothetical protein
MAAPLVFGRRRSSQLFPPNPRAQSADAHDLRMRNSGFPDVAAGYRSGMDPRLRCVSRTETNETDAASPPSEDTLLETAAALGFELVSYRSETDQTVWEWRHGDGPRPQFVTERVAREWMADWLARQPEVAQPQPLDERRRERGENGGAVPHVAESA